MPCLVYLKTLRIGQGKGRGNILIQSFPQELPRIHPAEEVLNGFLLMEIFSPALPSS
jgi:hypothetical protein